MKIVIGVLLVIIILLVVILITRRRKAFIAFKENEFRSIQKEYAAKKSTLENIFRGEQQQVQEKIGLLETLLAQKEQEKEKLLESGINGIKTALFEVEKREKLLLDERLNSYGEEIGAKTKNFEAVAAEQIASIQRELDEYKAKRDAITADMLRQKQRREQLDFYRLQLSDNDKQDISYILSIESNLKKSTILYKLIWSEYLQKPFNDMINRMFGMNEVKCVIYKITNISTQEVYIGKTRAEISKRWTDHIKTSLNIGTVARSKIHDALYSNWDNFTFEVIEQVKDENQLSQREKFYINYYQSNIVGYNMNIGG